MKDRIVHKFRTVPGLESGLYHNLAAFCKAAWLNHFIHSPVISQDTVSASSKMLVTKEVKVFENSFFLIAVLCV